MRALSICVAAFGLLALVHPVIHGDISALPLGIAALLCAGATYWSTGISSFLKIFIGIFSVETIVFGLAVVAGRSGLWPAAYTDYLPPDSLPLTVAIFAIICRVVAHSSTVEQVMRIADRYFNATEHAEARIWPFRPFGAMERSIAVAMVVFLVDRKSVV